MSDTVLIYMQAYNAEQTLSRALDSLLGQTYPNWKLHLINNGSDDKTGEIAQKYAAIDSRIHYEQNYPNAFWKFFSFFSEYSLHPSEGYFTWLDSDDELYPSFLEKMIYFLKTNKLDIAACGNDYIHAVTKEKINTRKLSLNLILDSKVSFDHYFEFYYQFMRTMWAKVFSTSILKNCKYKLNKELSYGTDTEFCMNAFLESTRVGVLAESLYKYYVSPRSLSYRYDEKRIPSDVLLYQDGCNFLLSKCGYVSKQNEQFLSIVYLNALKDTFHVIINSTLTPIEKVKKTWEMVTNKTGNEVLRGENARGETFEELRTIISNWLMAQKECRRPEGTKLVAEILLVLYPKLSHLLNSEEVCYFVRVLPEVIQFLMQQDFIKALERIQIYCKRHDKDQIELTVLEVKLTQIVKADYEVFSLYCDVKNNRMNCANALGIDESISKSLQKYPLLKVLTPDLAVKLSRVVENVMKGAYGEALSLLLHLENVEIRDDEIENYIQFSRNLSAAAEDSNVYLYFEKIWISYLIENFKCKEAKEELNEYLKILPQDTDFQTLKVKLENAQ